MQKILGFLATTALAFVISITPALAEGNINTSVYGALFQAGHLEDTSTILMAEDPQDPPPPPDEPDSQSENDTDVQGNSEAVLLYHPGTDGFVAITTNRAGAQWWTSNKFGLNWTQSTTNPVTERNCTQAGRHSVQLFNGEMYFGLTCESDALIFKLTGLETAELVHTLTVAPPEGMMAPGYPTSTVVNDTLVLFFNGGYSKSTDGKTWIDVTTAKNQPDNESIPLEAGTTHDGIVDVAFTTGQVATLDITTDTYTITGEHYLESGNTASTQVGGASLPAIEHYNNTVWVGNQDMTNGASIFKYDTAASNWIEAKQLDQNDTIVNKMELSHKINDTNYLVYFTSNAKVGTNIVGIGPDDNFINLVDSGLGGKNPENNTEVVSLIERNIKVGNKTLDIMLFGTQNKTDQTKIFALQLGGDLAFSPTSQDVLSDQKTLQGVHSLRPTELFTTYGQPFRIEVDGAQISTGDIFTLFINGQKVQRRRAKNGNRLVLKYDAAQYLNSGDSFTVQIGRKLGYGPRNGRVLSRNMVKGNVLQVIVE